jgi:ABC-type nitrate/sulfonate/bicarbonate transport system substrate-binding protein
MKIFLMSSPQPNKRKGGTMKRRSVHLIIISMVVLSLIALLFGACAPAQPAEGEKLTIWASPAAAVPLAVAKGEGYFEEQGLNIDFRVTQEDEPPFLAGQTPVSHVSTWESAEYRIEGEDVMIAGTGGATRFFNGIAIRPEDAGKYKSVQDLVGQKLGNPGFGTGTWGAFTGLAKKAWNIDTETAFENVTASPGALLGLLETGEIEGALLFSGQTIAAQASGFPLVFRFDKAWEETTGHPLLITSWIARAPWLRENVETMRKVNAAADKSLVWMAQFPEQFGIGGRYEIYADQAGWLRSPEANALIQKWLVEGLYYVGNDIYTQAWIDSAHDFNVVVHGNKAPAKAELFWPPEDLRSE